MAHATVSRCLTRRGMSRRPPPPKDEVRRFEWPCPGDLLQMDTKRLARFSRPGHAVTGDRTRTSAGIRERVGWEFCHSIIDDHTAWPTPRSTPTRKPRPSPRSSETALKFFAAHDIHPKRLQTDNAWCYIHNSSLRECSPPPDPTPSNPATHTQTQRQSRALPATMAREWAYGQRYRSSDSRATALPVWLNHYNTTRNHSSLSNRPPISRVRNQPRHNS